jgi:hypothetical protein
MLSSSVEPRTVLSPINPPVKGSIWRGVPAKGPTAEATRVIDRLDARQL